MAGIFNAAAYLNSWQRMC